MLIEIIQISAAIILGTVAFGIVLFFFHFLFSLLLAMIQGIREGWREILHENRVSSFKELVAKKRKEKGKQ